MPPPRPRRGGIDDLGGGVEDAFTSLPFVTKHWFSASIVVTIAGNFGVVGVRNLVWSWDAIAKNFEVWRLLTPFCWVAGFSFSLLILLYLQYNYSSKFERGGVYNTGAGGGTADYLFCLLFGMLMSLVTYPLVITFMPVPPVFAVNMIFYVMYLWSKRYPTAEVMIWFIPVKGQYLPFAYVAFDVITDGGMYPRMLHGIAMAHLYYFLVAVVPAVYGKDILHTPQFLIDQFGIGTYQPERGVRPARGGVNEPHDPAAPDGGGGGGGGGGRGGHNWGTGGRRLGSD